MSGVEQVDLRPPCGLNCGWCIYKRMEGIGECGCPGCFERERCCIRDCSERNECPTCEECASFPCYTFLQGYECMRERYECMRER